ncbi:MAG TPA: flagellar basal body L-ring protein FlgH [Rhodobacteraceae bacterium]|nr:flagellar basal body L-ring protein FlgH [Paracoccaceae bacterium]
MRFAPLIFLFLAACSGLNRSIEPPRLTPASQGREQSAMEQPGQYGQVDRRSVMDAASLWNSGRQSLLGDRRAVVRGDILTVTIEIDDKAEISNSSTRNRKGSDALSIPSLLGLPQRVSPLLPDGASMDAAISTTSSSSSSGDGSVRRKEKLTLRVAATIIDVLPNGILYIEGSQEVRVNFEIRELLVSGYIRPEDISRQNEITYDKIASARISYGGRGSISDAQQPRYGQRFLDKILPF